LLLSRYKWRWCKDNAAHCALLSAAINALDKQLGPDMVEVGASWVPDILPELCWGCKYACIPVWAQLHQYGSKLHVTRRGFPAVQLTLLLLLLLNRSSI
jgi:hypothetical protein